MPSPTVQAFLTDYATPAYASASSVITMASSLQTLIANLQKQIVQYQGDLNAIDLASPPPASLLVGQLEHLYQTVGAMQGSVNDLSRALRATTQIQNQWTRYMADFQTAVAAVDATIAVASVTITGIASPVKAGTTDQATATAKDASGNPLDVPITWQTSDATLATVSATGLITGVAVGTVTITATAGGVSATASVTIN